MEEMPSLNMLVQRLKVAILPLELPFFGPVTHAGEILTTGKYHGKKPDRSNLLSSRIYGMFVTIEFRSLDLSNPCLQILMAG